jgi:hypothetical protein
MMFRNHVLGVLVLCTMLTPCILFAMQANTSVLMVRPLSFGKNVQTASTNVFQLDNANISEEQLVKRALEEFDEMVSVLKTNGVDVHVFEESRDASPDSIFPNNWFSIEPHSKKLVLYPMMAENRRKERKGAIIDYLREHSQASSVIDLTSWETEERYLEGTGSIVFDYENRQAYACLSARTDYDLFNHLCDQLGYEPVVFSACDRKGVPIYHTNVMMAIGSQTVIICSESICEREERNMLLDSLGNSGRTIIDISYEQMDDFCGNVLEVVNASGKHFFVMSSRAFGAFDAQQIRLLTSNTSIIHSSLNTIECVGGGGARCMLGGFWEIE